MEVEQQLVPPNLPSMLLAHILVIAAVVDGEARTTVAMTMYHETKEKTFGFSHCWMIFNGKSKWRQLLVDLNADKERNDGSSSHQSIGLDCKYMDVVVENERATVPKHNQQVMGNKWEEARSSCDATANKIVLQMVGLFSVRENKK
ncbi:putative oxidoreductase [Hordeum vulgare]|nr:putative oxidoreductase [Hordeum vulgare]